MEILRRFRDGREEMALDSGHLRFWGYNFRYIPVELISAVYDRFLGHDEDARHEAGAYYTPMFLVDTVVTSVWEAIDSRIKNHGTFLDPACGSGIFLVRCFQRFCEHWREKSKQKTIRWDSLVKMLGRVHGRDLNGGAVRVAVFSLYIALLEEVTPSDILKLKAKGRMLPPLWNETLVQRDFFDDEIGSIQVDVVIGNPPWTSRRNTKSTGIEWCRSRDLPTPSGEDAWAFTWKARAHLCDGGVTAFLLPAMGFLHNHANNSIAARERLFRDVRVLRVVNFSDLRRQLFDGAINAAALIVFRIADETTPDYMLDYWTPKADLNLTIKRFIALSTIDRSVLRRSDVLSSPLVFKERLWMRPPEAKLFSYLNKLPKLGSFVTSYGRLARKNQHDISDWIIGGGFQPFNGPDRSLGGKSTFESTFVDKFNYLPIEAFSPVAISTDNLAPFGQSAVRRPGFERGYEGSRILIPRGVATATMRLRAAYVDEPLTFQDIIQAIAAPEGESDTAKFMQY